MINYRFLGKVPQESFFGKVPQETETDPNLKELPN